jgi:hypothetical protein
LSDIIIMSGSYNRKLYDDCDQAEQDRISKGNGNYNLSKDPKLHKASLRPIGVMSSRLLLVFDLLF